MDMKRHLKLIATLAAILLSTSAIAQGTESLYRQGKSLYDAKNYKQAFPKLKAAAEKGHKKAQYRVGLCYDTMPRLSISWASATRTARASPKTRRKPPTCS